MVVALKTINGRITKIKNGENKFREEMGVLSRELLSYVPETGDIDAVNRLMAVLNPKNKELAQKFFSTFLPHKWDTKELRFGKKSTNKEMIAKRRNLTTTFLSNEGNTIWTWMAEKAKPVERVAKPKKYAEKIEHLVSAALTDEKEAIDIKAMLRAIIHAGAKLADIMSALDEVAKEEAAIVKADQVKTDVKPRQQEQPVQRRVAAAVH